jgi:CTP:molybdopterin cytidylyltransferase MocA
MDSEPISDVPSLVLLAGDRGGTDPLAVYHGVSSKALVPIDGEPIILRVMRTLKRSTFSERLLIGPRQETLEATPELRAQIDAHGWRWLPPADSPAASVLTALAAVDNPAGVFVTTADHGLLSATLIDEFRTAAIATEAAMAIGFVRHHDVMTAFPGGRRTGWGFADDRYCGCNLYFFARPEASAVMELWRTIENERKKPWKVVSLLGAGALLKFLTRRLTLNDALGLLSARTGAEIAPVLLSNPAAAIDVDSIADWQLVDGLIRTG